MLDFYVMHKRAQLKDNKVLLLIVSFTIKVSHIDNAIFFDMFRSHVKHSNTVLD